MKTKDFWYQLPQEYIAQEPADPRDSARLMVLNRENNSIEHKIFRDITQYLQPGDLLVVNNSKVLPARLVGTKIPTGAVCELLLLRQVKGDIDGFVGSLAGDDTVIMIMRTSQLAEEFCREMEAMLD